MDNTRLKQVIRYLESTSPKQLLVDINEGLEPSEYELKVVEDLMNQYNLSSGVINVLIQYVLLKADMKLTISFVYAIASHWSREEVKTVQEAMEITKTEHGLYQGKITESYKKDSLSKVSLIRLNAIEKAVKDPNISNEQLGSFVRNMFSDE